MQFDFLPIRQAIFFCVGSFCLISPDTVVAAEWSVEPSISLSEEYNDNIRFTALPHSSVWQTSLSPMLKLSSKTELSEVSGSGRINFNRFAGDQGLNQNDELFSLLTSLYSERNTWTMNAAYKQDSTAESERLATGVVQIRTQRTLRSLNPSWTRALTERYSLKLDYNYQNVKYEEHINLNDYSFQQAAATLQYQLTERDQVGLSLSYSITDYSPTLISYPASIDINFGPPFGILPFAMGGTHTIATKSTLRGIQTSGSHLFSETLRGSLSLGWRRVETDASHVCNGRLGDFYALINSINCSGRAVDPLIAFDRVTEGNGSSFSANLEKTFDAAKVSGFASREVNPGGSGLVETDKFGVSLNRSLTENLTGSFDTMAYRTKYLSLAYPSSRYYTVEPKLNWQFSERWVLNAGYRYARFETDNVVDATTANIAYLNLVYNWPKMAISR